MRVVALLVFPMVLMVCGCGVGELTVPMRSESNSGQVGQTTLTEAGAQVKVTVAIAAGADSGGQPAHLHRGRCGQIGEIRYGLTPIVNGASETLLDATMEEVQGLAINVHNSSDPNVYLSCGNIPGTPAPKPGETQGYHD